MFQSIFNTILTRRTMVRNRFRLGPVVLPALLLLLGLFTPAAAAPPVRIEIEAIPFTVPAGEGCSFAVLSEPLEPNRRVTQFFDQAGNIRSVTLTGLGPVRFTNLSSGKTLNVNLSGKLFVDNSADGSTKIVTTGPTFAFLDGSATGEPTLAIIRGRTVTEFDASFNLVSFEVTGNVEDLCVSLAGN